MTAVENSVAAALGTAPVRSQPARGGCVHQTLRLDLADGRRVFVKSAPADQAAWLAAEAQGLALLSPHLRTPHILGHGGAADGRRWLALEWLDLQPLDAAGWEDLGRQLASLHAAKAAHHGLAQDNFLGTTPQANQPAPHWCGFYLDRRLRPQLRLARSHGYDLPEAEILRRAALVLADHEPAPSLLHGDLWAGNTAALPGSNAVVFDPAPYYGDPETDLAMLELFDPPLSAAFLRGYGPLPAARERRRPVYDLYHALNHLHLFGSGYLSLVRRCLAALGVR